jgi:DNA ligase-1
MNQLFKALSNLERIKKVGGRNAKIALLTEVESTELLALLNVALNPYLTLGARVPKTISEIHPQTTFAHFNQTVLDLSTRHVSGGAAQVALANLVEGVPLELQPIFTDVLNKEPRIGVDVKTVNTVWDKFVPVFSPQLANDSGKRPFPKYAVAEPKFDGLRALLCVAGKTYLLSRKGLPLYNAENVIAEAVKYELPPGVYDGELFGQTFHQSVGTAHRSKSAATEELNFHVFDRLAWVEWNQRKCKRTFQDRRTDLADVLKRAPYECIKLVEQRPVTSMLAALQLAKIWKDQGLEGAVVKDLDAHYLFKRTDAWLKVKFTSTYDIPVVAVQIGRGKYAGSLGKLVCLYKSRTVRVGSGLSDELRDLWWAKPELIVGKTIEVKADEDETHKGSLRFPRFVRIREDK